MSKPCLENLLLLNAIGIEGPCTVNSDDEVLHKFCESVRFDDERYHIVWP